MGSFNPQNRSWGRYPTSSTADWLRWERSFLDQTWGNIYIYTHTQIDIIKNLRSPRKMRDVCYSHVVRRSQLDINLRRVTAALLVMFICNSYTLAIMCSELILPCLGNRAFT